jgi:nucleoside-diphosphate-sugar epimerase
VKWVLITGATGFIGGHLVKANLSKGHPVRAFVLPDDPEDSVLRSKADKWVRKTSGGPIVAKARTIRRRIVEHYVIKCNVW